MKVKLVMSLLGQSHHVNRVDYGILTTDVCQFIVWVYYKTLGIIYTFLLQSTALCKRKANNRFYSEMLAFAAFSRANVRAGSLYHPCSCVCTRVICGVHWSRV